MWLNSKCTSKHKSLKPLPKFVGPFTILQVDDNHTYRVEQNGRVGRESEIRFKTYFSSANVAGRAPRSEDPNRQPTKHDGMMVERKRWQAKMPEL